MAAHTGVCYENGNYGWESSRIDTRASAMLEMGEAVGGREGRKGEGGKGGEGKEDISRSGIAEKWAEQSNLVWSTSDDLREYKMKWKRVVLPTYRTSSTRRDPICSRFLIPRKRRQSAFGNDLNVASTNMGNMYCD